ncbi:hypothetical protein J1D01_03045 [Seonamhaeicola sp. NFXS20]|uniref:hypothetical protein n=1 Tax=Seonamhaeicola sp. NFXS20 TaxID=2816959 RepID=UPI003B8D0294
MKNCKYKINSIYFFRYYSNITNFIGTLKRTDNLFVIKLIAYVKEFAEKNIKIKIAISLRTLLKKSKQLTLTKGKDDSIADSYNNIALNAEIRKATVTKIFNAKTSPNSTTLILIIEAMGFKLSDFSVIYDSLQEKDIQLFIKNQKEK